MSKAFYKNIPVSFMVHDVMHQLKSECKDWCKAKTPKTVINVNYLPSSN